MPIYNIRGYDVDFPHEAYPCQITYMEQVLGALEQGENALLESPTGTGKTLCLLCATLAWREAFVKKGKDAAKEGSSALTLYDYQQQQAGIGAPADPAAAQHKGPSIIYSSRTHSQLAQVIKELRNTSYRVRTTVLGSRTQLCLHDKVSKLAGQAANFTCRALVAHKQCRWHTKHRQERVMKELSSAVPAPVDIEELVKIGRHAEVCPYFLSRDMANTAEVIFMPYNYLVDSQSRSQLSGINWTNAVIIIDEAHNIQDACNSNASFDLSGDQLLAAIQEMESAAGVVKENISSGRAQEGLTVYHEGGQLMPSSDAGQQAELLDRLGLGVKLLSALYQRVCELDPAAGPAAAAAAAGGSSSGSALGDGVAHKGEALLAMLGELQITPESYSGHLQPLLMDAAGVLSDHELASGRAMAARSGVVAGGLSALLAALDIVFASALPLWIDPVRRVNGPPAHRGYRMFVHKPENKQGGGKKGRGTLVMGGSPTLSYWCFIPGVSMVSLRQLPLRSVLLTSGTLSPLESFAHELQLGFKYTLENPHVINNDQVWVGVIGSGPTGVTLNSSFANRNSDRYKDELGHAIVNFARVVPDGLLVFFPAYGVMQSCLDHWKASSGPGGGPSIWERILRHKAPMVEPRDSGSFGAAIADYQAKLDDPAGGGAVLFAVCRGKVSEGIDFSDKAGRGVVITGLPFPAAHDPHVKLQQQLLDEEARAGAAGISGGRGLSGQQWYVQQGLRAVNQAMGRVIRHRWDYGAVLLADERFGSAQNKRHLSRWLREQVTSHSSFGGAIGSLTKFFKDKGDIAASAAAARAAGPAAAASNAACPSAFQLIGGAEGQPGQGSRAAARSAAAEQQQRRQQLMAVPRAVDVLGLIGREEGGSSGAAAAAAAAAGEHGYGLDQSCVPEV
ncbi:hypothetical protein OEZ86_014079 [Tetradesmus obliquus]|nr:hypothetical protein OEZ86_014079 [Tetradesmus obliquus]